MYAFRPLYIVCYLVILGHKESHPFVIQKTQSSVFLPEVTSVSGSLMSVGSYLLSAAQLFEGGKRVGIFLVTLPSLTAL